MVDCSVLVFLVIYKPGSYMHLFSCEFLIQIGTESKRFHLLNQLSDLLMLPKEVLLEIQRQSGRKRVAFWLVTSPSPCFLLWLLVKSSCLHSIYSESAAWSARPKSTCCPKGFFRTLFYSHQMPRLILKQHFSFRS